MNTIPIGYVTLEVVQSGPVSNGTLPPIRNSLVRFNTYPGSFYFLGANPPVFRVDTDRLKGSPPSTNGYLRDIKTYPPVNTPTGYPTTLPGVAA